MRFVPKMASKFSLISVLALVAAVAAVSDASVIKKQQLPANVAVNSGPIYAHVYEGANESGYGYAVTSYISDLSKYGVNNDISSECSTGIWIYYDNTDYNTNQAGQVVWFHGIKYCGNFNSLNNMATSIRYAGSNTVLDQSSFTLYEGQGFQGLEMYSENSQTDLRNMNARAQSIILTGTSAWTFYTESNYQGYHTCVQYQHTDTLNGVSMHYGLFPKITNQYFNKAIKSVRKGCYSDNIMEVSPLSIIQEAPNGAMGSFNVTNL